MTKKAAQAEHVGKKLGALGALGDGQTLTQFDVSRTAIHPKDAQPVDIANAKITFAARLPIAGILDERAKAQTRHHFDSENNIEDGELLKSIEQHGVITPIQVQIVMVDTQKMYRLISGERRLEASKRLGNDTIKANVFPVNMGAEHVDILTVTENALRSNLTPLEQAQAIQHLVDTYEYVVTDVCTMLGISKSKAYRLLGLLKMPEDVQTRVEAGVLGVNAADELSSLGPESREAVYGLVESSGLAWGAAITTVKSGETSISDTPSKSTKTNKKNSKTGRKKSKETSLDVALGLILGEAEQTFYDLLSDLPFRSKLKPDDIRALGILWILNNHNMQDAVDLYGELNKAVMKSLNGIISEMNRLRVMTQSTPVDETVKSIIWDVTKVFFDE